MVQLTTYLVAPANVEATFGAAQEVWGEHPHRRLGDKVAVSLDRMSRGGQRICHAAEANPWFEPPWPGKYRLP